MLDLLHVPLNAATYRNNKKINYVQITGQTKRSEREEFLELFANDPKIRVCLLSLRACGVGLNLTMANHVFFLDPWWNPQVEYQALDRVHRLGQTKPVFVYKFFIKVTILFKFLKFEKDSIEDKILKLQEDKKELADGALGDSDKIKLTRLTMQDLMFLFS